MQHKDGILTNNYNILKILRYYIYTPIL